jgi:hypothetical protein
MAALFTFSAFAYASNIVVDSGFESAGGGNTYSAGQSIDGGAWTVGAGTVYVDNLDPYVFDGNNSVNLTGANDFAINSLYQNLSTVVGQEYQVSFWANSDALNAFSLTENGLALSGIPGSIVQNGFPDQIDALGNSSHFVEYSGEFVATSATTDLDFSAIGEPTLTELQNGQGSVVIDDTSVSPAPEPGSMVLMLTGIVGLGLLIARKRLGQFFLAGVGSKGMAGRAFSLLALSAVTACAAASAQAVFTPGNLVVSRSVYEGTASTVTVGETLPPGCVPVSGSKSVKVTCGTAAVNGAFPTVFNNATPDGSFGVTSPIFLDELTLGGSVINTLEVPNSTTTSGDQLVTSFSSKSEEALHLSLDGNYLSFIDYVAPVNTIDVSNGNTPGVIDPTNPVPGAYYRAVATVNADGQFTFTETNAYSGNNGRAAIYVNTNGNNYFYTAGNAGNGDNPEPQEVVDGAGVQLIQAVNESESSQTPGLPTPVASFSPIELPGGVADKVGKDDNFRGMTLYNNVLYLTKGSGGNGIDTVYFVDTTGTACPNGVGLPVAGAALPTTNLAPTYNATTGLANNMCILAGFPTTVVANLTTTTTAYPFGLWFANPTTLYVADEGTGSNTYNASSNTYTDAAAEIGTSIGGLQKWIFNSTTHTWQLAYTLQTGLNLGTPYTLSGYLTADNTGTDGTGLPWAPATDGLRNIIGTIGGNRFTGSIVYIWATSSTVSGDGDEGADPNKLYLIADKLTNTSPTVAAGESFTDLYDATYGEVLRGVSFTPGTTLSSDSY